MSLGINSTGNGGQPPIGSASEKAASGPEKVKAGDSSKFNEAIDAKVGERDKQASDSGERVEQSLADNNQLQLPDHSKGATPGDGSDHVSLVDDGPGFLDDLLEHDESGYLTDAAGFTGEIQGFNVPIESFGQRVSGTFSAPAKASSAAQDSPEASDDVSGAAESDSAPDNEEQETASIDSEENKPAEEEEVENEPPKPAGTFSFGDDALAKFMGEGANDSDSYRHTGGFIA